MMIASGQTRENAVPPLQQFNTLIF